MQCLVACALHNVLRNSIKKGYRVHLSYVLMQLDEKVRRTTAASVKRTVWGLALSCVRGESVGLAPKYLHSYRPKNEEAWKAFHPRVPLILECMGRHVPAWSCGSLLHLWCSQIGRHARLMGGQNEPPTVYALLVKLKEAARYAIHKILSTGFANGIWKKYRHFLNPDALQSTSSGLTCQ